MGQVGISILPCTVVQLVQGVVYLLSACLRVCVYAYSVVSVCVSGMCHNNIIYNIIKCRLTYCVIRC